MKILKKTNGKYVFVEGIFNGKEKAILTGVLEQFDNITRYEVGSSLNHH